MQAPPATAVIYMNNATVEVIGYGGYYYELLLWLSHQLNFRYLVLILYRFTIRANILLRDI